MLNDNVQYVNKHAQAVADVVHAIDEQYPAPKILISSEWDAGANESLTAGLPFICEFIALRIDKGFGYLEHLHEFEKQGSENWQRGGRLILFLHSINGGHELEKKRAFVRDWFFIMFSGRVKLIFDRGGINEDTPMTQLLWGHRFNLYRD